MPAEHGWSVCKFDDPQAFPKSQTKSSGGFDTMLELVSALLVVLWIFGLVTSYTLGGFIHILIVAAAVIVLVRIIRNRRA